MPQKKSDRKVVFYYGMPFSMLLMAFFSFASIVVMLAARVLAGAVFPLIATSIIILVIWGLYYVAYRHPMTGLTEILLLFVASILFYFLYAVYRVDGWFGVSYTPTLSILPGGAVQGDVGLATVAAVLAAVAIALAVMSRRGRGRRRRRL